MAVLEAVRRHGPPVLVQPPVFLATNYDALSTFMLDE